MRGLKELLLIIAAVSAFAVLCFGLGIRTGMQVQKEIALGEVMEEWVPTPPCPQMQVDVPKDNRRLRTDI